MSSSFSYCPIEPELQDRILQQYLPASLSEQLDHAGNVRITHAVQRVAKHDDLIDVLTLQLGQGRGKPLGIVVNVRQYA